MNHHRESETRSDTQAAKKAFVAEKTLALVGVPRKRGFGKQLFAHLKRTGYKVLPVNAQADSIDGERCYRRLDDLPEPVGAVVTVVPPAETEKIVETCGRLGIGRIWMQQGSESPTAVARCRDLGIAVVAGECLIMHTEGGFPHSMHRLIWRLMGKY
jgi:uncharacterized protein